MKKTLIALGASLGTIATSLASVFAYNKFLKDTNKKPSVLNKDVTKPLEDEDSDIFISFPEFTFPTDDEIKKENSIKDLSDEELKTLQEAIAKSNLDPKTLSLLSTFFEVEKNDKKESEE